MKSGRTTVSTTPLEWRSRVRAVAGAQPLEFRESDAGQWLLFLRGELANRHKPHPNRHPHLRYLHSEFRLESKSRR